MSLVFYEDRDCTSEAQNISTTHNGFTGEADLITVYLKNDDPAKLYENVEVKLEISVQLKNKKWESKAHLGNDVVSLQEWNELEPTVNVGNIEDTDTVYTLQFRLFCPAGEESKVYTSADDFNIKLTATEI
jgi:hypothetical protein